MKHAAEKMIFTAAAGHGGRKFAITHRAAKRAHAADEPEHDHGESRRQIAHLKAQRSENARADHVRHDDGRGGGQG